uniref:Uncharacterized protein n=1 Tax=Anguilla anguilla TaxID=7936 RepID=A0A0E9XID6_ANGAN
MVFPSAGSIALDHVAGLRRNAGLWACSLYKLNVNHSLKAPTPDLKSIKGEKVFKKKRKEKKEVKIKQGYNKPKTLRW